MPKITEIVTFLDNYLRINDIDDGSWNGLQIEGRPELETGLLLQSTAE